MVGSYPNVLDRWKLIGLWMVDGGTTQRTYWAGSPIPMRVCWIRSIRVPVLLTRPATSGMHETAWSSSGDKQIIKGVMVMFSFTKIQTLALCKKKILRHIKLAVHTWSTKC